LVQNFAKRTVCSLLLLSAANTKKIFHKW
jgi:hypothetical protein